MMEQRYQQQQQQQQYYYGGYQNQSNNNYPMQYPNNQPYSGQPIQQQSSSQSERGRGSSFDAANGYPIDPNMGGVSGYGSIPPPPSRPRTNSKEFSATMETFSILF